MANQDPVVFELTVQVTQAGNVNVSGPLQNKIICLGALELAKEAVSKFRPAGVLGAHGGMMPSADPGEPSEGPRPA